MKQEFHNCSLKGKRILLTGATGFIGSHLLRRLMEEEAEASVILRSSNTWRIEDVLKDANVIRLDLRNDEEIRKALMLTKPHIVFHLAAYGVELGNCTHREAILNNVLATANLVIASAEAGCQRFINTGTSMEYGCLDDMISEDVSPKPVNLYGSTKAASTLIAHQAALERDLPIITLRPFNLFGEMEANNKLFSYIIASILLERPVKLTGCEQYRDYCYVGNIVDGYIMAALNDTIRNEIYNIGSGEIQPLKYYINMIYELMLPDQKPVYGTLPYRKNEMWRPCPDISKIKSQLQWVPRTSLKEGLLKTIEWYIQNKELLSERKII